MDLSAWIIAIFNHRTPFKSQLIHRSPVELIKVLPDAQLQNLPTHELEVCEWEGVLIAIAGNFRKTSSTYCYISVFSTAVIAIISEFLLKHWLYLMYVKRDVLTCYPYWGVVLDIVCHWYCMHSCRWAFKAAFWCFLLHFQVLYTLYIPWYWQIVA